MSQPSPDATSPHPPSSSAHRLLSAGASPVVRATFSMHGFMDGWLHCQHVAEYLARFAASDRFDPERLTTRLATYLNELLELVFRSAPGPGLLVVAIDRVADRLEVAVCCPLATDGADRIRHSVRRATHADLAADYRRIFLELLATPSDPGSPERDLDAGLLELVALHGVTLALREASDALVLHMTVPHE